MVPILIPFLRLRSDVILHVLSATSLPFSVEWLILDEADKLFEDGKLGFRDQVRDFLCRTKANLQEARLNFSVSGRWCGLAPPLGMTTMFEPHPGGGVYLQVHTPRSFL